MKVDLLSSNLPEFFQNLGECSFDSSKVPGGVVELPSENQLVGLFEDLGELVSDQTLGSVNFGNPWSIAGLRRDEVRNAAVLKWFLDPRGGHGLHAGLLNSLLTNIPDFPLEPSSYCRLAVEDCPDGSRDSRVDIRIDDPGNFFLIIEVKIDAGEQIDQLQRYCQIAEACARDGRPWKVIYLTCTGAVPKTAGIYFDDVVPYSWSKIASHLWDAAKKPKNGHEISRFLAKTFAKHISRF
ncbi:PD-(D/E)XK nuclease family protein [Emcibacter sp.]|uniref:PD-(D/E)XK nuclease family protein n=1 Tax=Emcibacter sp. TaxID=1979954 RepID=UPI003A8E3B49